MNLCVVELAKNAFSFFIYGNQARDAWKALRNKVEEKKRDAPIQPVQV